MSESTGGVAILGIFVADVTFRADRQPDIGETIVGSGFKLGPGGKGSNQAVAAARLEAPVTFLTKVGDDAFGRIAQDTWASEGVAAHMVGTTDEPTGAAYIFVHEVSGDNAIIVYPGAPGTITPDEVDGASDVIRQAEVFLTQLEQPPEAAHRGLAIAREAGVTTIFNPAPAEPFDEALYPLCDYVTPNESEAKILTGVEVDTLDNARRAGDVLLSKGVGAALITLGETGALLHTGETSELVPSFEFGPVVETTGAGDAFNGGFAVALSRGLSPRSAVRFGCAVAGISVTRAGTAPSMPSLGEVEALLVEG